MSEECHMPMLYNTISLLLWASLPLRRLPLDILIYHLDRTGLAVNAVLAVDL